MISFVIPAHNEAALIGATVQTLHLAITDLALEAEIVVVNDASTDETALMAVRAGARVIEVDRRQIAAARNAGAKAARGETLVFVDADTLVPQPTIEAGLASLESAAAAGCRVAWDPTTPPIRGGLMEPCLWVLRRLGVMPGCCIFVTRERFEAIGGFDEQHFAGEEIHLSRALRRLGPIVFVRPPVVSSGRKIRDYSAWSLALQVLRICLVGTRRRHHLPIWYEAPRDSQ